jgi:hypothetical protein
MEKKRVEDSIFPSMGPVMAERLATEGAGVGAMLHPDISKRFRYPSMGDPPRSKPVSAAFTDDVGICN